MVYIIDLDEDAAAVGEPAIQRAPHLHRHDPPSNDDDDDNDGEHARVLLFSSALGCYPIVSQIAAHLDLNSLHDLALTCRGFRENMIQFRGQLVKQTLRCVNDEVPLGPRLAARVRHSQHALKQHGHGTLTSGRVGLCARDMVGDCRSCGGVYCRNCTVKPPPASALRGRHRRLCKACMKAPLHRDTPDACAFFTRGPCTCADMLHICLTCGTALRSADTTYIRGWTWRTRYSHYLGGLGTGIGEGNEGVECGRGGDCLAAREVEKEVDCDAQELALIQQEEQQVEGPDRQWSGTSYLTQEIEGIGGIVKRKVKKRVRLGAVVKEYEDERDDGQYLARERQGSNRSWCAWCARVILGQKDSPVGASTSSSVASQA